MPWTRRKGRSMTLTTAPCRSAGLASAPKCVKKSGKTERL